MEIRIDQMLPAGSKIVVAVDVLPVFKAITRNTYTVEVEVIGGLPVESGLVRRWYEFCPPLVARQSGHIERWWFPDARNREEVENYLEPLLAQGIKFLADRDAILPPEYEFVGETLRRKQ